MGIFWPSAAVEYEARWPLPADPEYFVTVIADSDGAPLPATFISPTIYRQPDVAQAGYNPNDEHALLLGGSLFALRDDFGSGLSPAETDAPSDPYVIVEYTDATDGNRKKLRVYKVIETSPEYPDFHLDLEAGKAVRPPHPLDVLSGDCSGPTTIDGEDTETDPQPPLPFYRDHRGGLWARAAGEGTVRFHYPLQETFFFFYENPDVPDTSVAPGTCIPFLGRHADPEEPEPVARWPRTTT
jgi:hypothetical protein